MTRIAVVDDYLPTLSHIDLADLQIEWRFARNTQTERATFHRMLGLGHLAMADGRVEDADTYFFLADILEL